MKKDSFFWYCLIPSIVLLTLLISFSPWLAELLATPKNQIFTGINRWSTDYFLYLSYIEQGVRGFLTTKLIFTTQPHPSVFFYLGYAIPGFIFGHIMGFNSLIIYHLFRALYGIIFLFMTVIFFYKLSRSKIITLSAFILTFYISGFIKINSFIPLQGVRYLDWLQEQNIIGRSSGPLHYNLGFMFFIGAFIFYFYSKAGLLKKTIILGLLLNGLLLSNPFNFLLMILCFAIYLPLKLLFVRDKDQLFVAELKNILGAVLISLPLFLILNYYLSMPPWGIVGVSPKFYVKTTPPVSLVEAGLSVGPIFFLGILGSLMFFLKKKGSLNLSVLLFLNVWPMVQFFLLIFGDQFKIHPPRAFSGLYYLPLAFFSSSFIVYFSKKINKMKYQYIVILTVLLLFLLTLPNFYLSYKEQLFAFTDFKNYSLFVYPTKKQVDAFKYLEKNTPAYSGVLAMYEASTLINGFSGNSTEVGLDQNIKTSFFANKLSDKEAKKLLIKHHFKYVYFGFQEKNVGGDISKYPFLKKIFENEEVAVYKLL